MGHNIVPETLGGPEFGWMIPPLIVGTVVIALGLQDVIQFIRRIDGRRKDYQRDWKETVGEEWEAIKIKSGYWGREGDGVNREHALQGLKNRFRRGRRDSGRQGEVETV